MIDADQSSSIAILFDTCKHLGSYSLMHSIIHTGLNMISQYYIDQCRIQSRCAEYSQFKSTPMGPGGGGLPYFGMVGSFRSDDPCFGGF